MDEATFLRILDALAVAITSLERRVMALEQRAQSRGRPGVQGRAKDACGDATGR